MKEPIKMTGTTVVGHESILAVGPIGSGKTTQIRSLPGLKFVYAFDPGCIAALTGAPNIEVVPFVVDRDDLDLSIQSLSKDKSTGKPIRDKTKRAVEPTTYVEWEEDFSARLNAKYFDRFDWLCLDSYTTLGEAIMDRVLHLSKHLGKMPEQSDYGPQMEALKNVTRAFHGLRKNLYFTAHNELYKDDVSGRVHGRIMLTGRMRIRIPLMFSNIFAFSAEIGKQDKARYYIQTVQDRENPIARTSKHGLKPYEDVTIDWEKEVEGEQGIGRLL